MSEEKNNGRMNKYAARALLARVYLYHNDNRKAFDMADQLIKDVDASGSYALYPHEKYVAAWSVETKFGSESFFEIANSVDDTPGRDSWGYLLTGMAIRRDLSLRNMRSRCWLIREMCVGSCWRRINMREKRYGGCTN